MQSTVHESSATSEMVAILDAGSQYGKLIDRRLRELNVATVLLPLDTPVERLAHFKALIISGGPESVYSPTAPPFDPRLFTYTFEDVTALASTQKRRPPILGICYGMQLMNYVFEGKVEQKDAREDGQFVVRIDTASPLFAGLLPEERVLLTHGDSLDEAGVAPGFQVIARSGSIVAGIQCVERKLYGLQFHPEVDLTENGRRVLENFVVHIAGVAQTFSVEDRQGKAIEEIQKAAGEDKHVLALVSGGVDSSVLAALLHRALPADRITAIHIDHGFMRKDESKGVVEALRGINVDLQVIDAATTFASATLPPPKGTGKRLDAVVNPEEKRQIIGDTFMTVADQAVAKLKLPTDSVLLAQGTLRPDLIESASGMVSGKAAVIKTHHNDTHLVRLLRAQGRVVEPLKDYHKDEVRVLGALLGLPESLVWRQPFPGPGLAVRILCTEKPYIGSDEEWQKTNTMLRSILAYHTLATESDVHTVITRMLARQEDSERLHTITARGNIKGMVLPIQSVGVQGDGRSYSHPVALFYEGGSGDKRGNGQKDIPWDDLMFLASIIPRYAHGVNRAVLMFGEKPTSEEPVITPTHLTPDVLDQLREADAIVNEQLLTHGLMRKISQVPVVLVPLPVMNEGHRSVVIRTLITNDFMTGHVAKPGSDLPEAVLETMVQRLLQVPGIARVAYDLTPKPPATTEWE